MGVFQRKDWTDNVSQANEAELERMEAGIAGDAAEIRVGSWNLPALYANGAWNGRNLPAGTMTFVPWTANGEFTFNELNVHLPVAGTAGSVVTLTAWSISKGLPALLLAQTNPLSLNNPANISGTFSAVTVPRGVYLFGLVHNDSGGLARFTCVSGPPKPLVDVFGSSSNPHLISPPVCLDIPGYNALSIPSTAITASAAENYEQPIAIRAKRSA